MLPIAQLYQSYAKKVFNLAYRITGDRAEAEDILQEVFVLVMRNADKFKGDSSVYSWIFAITKNVSLRFSKRTFRGFEKLIQIAERPAQASFDNELERRYYIQQVKDGCLTGLLRCLSFHQRIAFILQVLFDIPTTTISAILNKSENSVRILVSRAKAKLRAFLCSNCSLYDSANSCKCENMVRFSLQNAWITKFDRKTAPVAIEAELKDFKNEVLLYQSLLDQDPPRELPPDILARDDLMILSRRKVK
jgi:RNA polymerase sigma factor (sigma-70 family)